MMSESDQSSSVTDNSDLPEDEGGALGRLEKGPHAFRTISEVADELQVPQHVLRFWETRFEQVRPLKRGGGRRYYRPADVDLLRHISDLLYTKGYTVKGVQRLLREGEAETVQQAAPVVTAVLSEPSEPSAGVQSASTCEPASEQTFPVVGQREEAPEHEGALAVSSVKDVPDQMAAASQETLAVQEQPCEDATPPESATEVAPVFASESASSDVVRRLEKQNIRLKHDLADILVELETFRNRLTA